MWNVAENFYLLHFSAPSMWNIFSFFCLFKVKIPSNQIIWTTFDMRIFVACLLIAKSRKWNTTKKGVLNCLLPASLVFAFILILINQHFCSFVIAQGCLWIFRKSYIKVRNEVIIQTLHWLLQNVTIYFTVIFNSIVMIW